ncbi:hypothetical protein Ancab_018879 [Ancistrocladus abbreviatus]
MEKSSFVEVVSMDKDETLEMAKTTKIESCASPYGSVSWADKVELEVEDNCVFDLNLPSVRKWLEVVAVGTPDPNLGVLVWISIRLGSTSEYAVWLGLRILFSNSHLQNSECVTFGKMLRHSS